MIIDNINLSDLPDNREEAFVEYDRRLRAAMMEAEETDQRIHRDRDGDYVGHHTPQRFYVSSILAFLDEYGFENNELKDISDLADDEFIMKFSRFFNQVNYLVSRYSLRTSRFDSGTVGTPLLISSDYKTEISALLETIRKIVNQEISDQNRKDVIIKKISSLYEEVNRDRTTVDAVFSRLLDFSAVAKQFGEDLDPLVDKIERLKKVFFQASEIENLLPKSKRPKEISAPDDTERSFEIDDEIPF